jgi:hypothetical protein
MASSTTYLPPGVYTSTQYETPPAATVDTTRVPVIIGVGQETLSQLDFEVVRGSSALVDQRIPDEDETGRAVVSIDTVTGAITLGNFNADLRTFRVRNYPITDGTTGTATTNPANVSVTVNGQPTLVLSVDGTRGLVELSSAPPVGAEVLCTYFFDRTDTQETDDVSAQVTATAAIIDAAIAGPYVVTAGVNDTLVLSVNGGQFVTRTITSGSWNATQLAAIIQSLFTGVTGSAYTNNFAQTAVRLSTQNSLVIGNGTANNLLGFSVNQATSRNSVFYVYQGPITDGSNSGVTTTDVADVVVRVNGVVTPAVLVDGANRSVTLALPPASGSTVTIQYFWNAWQDTFDYLFNTNVTEITLCGIAPGSSDYIEEADFVLANDKIVWGAAALVTLGNFSAGSTQFESQISTTLVDQRTYLEPCTRVVNTNVNPPVESSTQFQLSNQPTIGNGRDTPISVSLFSSVSNGRVDVPSNRPDLIQAYWGYSATDALDRGPVGVVKVDAATSTITLRDPVPAGATVFATFYYNILQDQEYDVVSVIPGPSGIGEYRVFREDELLYGGSFASKGAALATIAVQFPSGSELTPDIRFESNGSSLYVGPVSEVVTVNFADKPDTNAIYTFPGVSPYYPISLGGVGSFNLRLTVDNTTLTGTSVNLANPLGISGADAQPFFGVLVGGEVSYDPAGGYTDFAVIDATNDELEITVDGVPISVSLTNGSNVPLSSIVADINTAVDAVFPTYTSAGAFTSYTVTAGDYDELTFHYTGDNSGLSGDLTITIPNAAYVSPSALALAIETEIAAEIAILVVGDPNFTGLTIAVSANSSGNLVFELERAGGDASGYLEFIDGATALVDFAIIAGIDTASATLDGQTAIVHGPVAWDYSIGSSPYFNDRLLLRNRILPGGASINASNSLSQVGISVNSGSALSLLNIEIGATGTPAFGAVVTPASVLGKVGWDDGQDVTSFTQVVFYDGTGANAANDVFRFTYNGTSVTVNFTSSAGGTATALGPIATATTVTYQIAFAMVTAGLFLNVTAVINAKAIRLEGAGFRITSNRADVLSRVEIGNGSANSRLGFIAGSLNERQSVTAGAIASALNNHRNLLGPSVYGDPASTGADYFANLALAFVREDEAGNEYVSIQSNDLGFSSSITLLTATSSDANSVGTNLLGVSGTGAVGESGYQGFYVTSSDSQGSGSADTSTLNSGVGQDGVIGQTYRDAVTGLTFTVLPRVGGLSYPTSGTSFFTINVTGTHVTNANLPVRVIPGVEMIVSNTSGVLANDSAVVTTYDGSGNEPRVGDSYYVSYIYQKDDISTPRIFTRLSAVEAEYGPVSPQNPLSLAAYLMFLNGASVIAFKQLVRAANSGDATESQYIASLNELRGQLPGQISPSVIVPLAPATTALATAVAQHCTLQSSSRFKSERTANMGFAAGTEPSTAGRLAETIRNERFRVLYPDVLTMSLTDAFGATSTFTVDGRYLAAAWTGRQLSAVNDVATPWTSQVIVGFNTIGRTLLDPDKDALAQRGVTIVETSGSTLRVRDGLTTNMANILTQIPTVAQIADEVQIRTRATLQRFIGTKFLASVTSQIEGAISTMFKSLVRANIITSYTGISATPDPESPVSINVQGYYKPVFPLLYILVRYFLRSS